MENPQMIFLATLALGIILLLFVSAICFLTIIPNHNTFKDYLKDPKFWIFGSPTLIYLIILIKTVGTM